MQATPNNNKNNNNNTSTIELTTAPSTQLLTTTPTAATTINFGTTLKPTVATTTRTKTIERSLSKKTTNAAGITTTSSSLSSTIHQSDKLTASKEIEEISKKISEHADAIYRTWKNRGLAPTELLDIYTNAAAVQAQQQGVGDIFGGCSVEAATAAVDTTEGLQQLVNQFVIKDKEQRGVVKKTSSLSSSSTSSSTLNTTTRTTTNYIGGTQNFGQRTNAESTIKIQTEATMPENIGSSKMTQKSALIGGGGTGVGIALKQSTSTPLRATGIQKPTSSTSASSTAILMKSNSNKNNNNKNSEHTSVKKLAKSTASTSSSTTPTPLATTSSSLSSSGMSMKNNACVKNINSNQSIDDASKIKLKSSSPSSETKTKTATGTTAATPTTIKRQLGSKTATTTTATSTQSPAPQTLDINLNLDLGFDELQLDVNSLTQLQTRNLKKIKALIKENEQQQNNEALKKATTTTKIATKTNKLRPNSPTTQKSLTTQLTDAIDAPITTTSPTTPATIKTTKSKTISETNLINEQSNENNNSNEQQIVVVNVKKMAKNLNSNSNNNNNKTNLKSSNNNNQQNSCIGETNDDATISKLMKNNDKKISNSTTSNNTNNNKYEQAGAKTATTTNITATKSKSLLEQKKPTISTTTTTPKTAATALNVGGDQPRQQSIKVIANNNNTNSICNGSQAEITKKQLHNELDENVIVAKKSTIIKANKKDKDNVSISSSTSSSSNNNNKKSNESEVKKSIKSEKINGNNNTANLKTAIVETAAATANVIEIAQQQLVNSNAVNINDKINSNHANSSNNKINNSVVSITTSKTISSNISSNSSSGSNMPAPTKFKSGRAAPGAAQQDKLNRPFLTRGSVAERVLMFEKCPNVRNAFLNINRPDPADAPPKSLLKAKLHATPPPPPEQRSLQQEIRTLKSVYIPRFYFPHGKPQPQIAQERVLRNILSAFDSFPNNQVTKDELPRILKLCGLPFYWRMPVMVYCQQQGNSGLVERMRFVEFWKQMNVYCHDAASRFVYILSRGQRFRSYILPEDLVPLVQDVVDTHPGLAFLKEATEFHSRYVHTVIARIFYSVNRCWSGKITMSELKKSDLLEILSLLEEEDDINQIMAFFSYEHFYVIYCKFWELDKDHDLLINQDDLARHSDHALSTRIVERIFSGCVTRSDNKRNPNEEPKMSYTDFVWFLLSEEDKRTPTAIEYWFRCMDLDGDGVLSMYELEYFYEEQQQRMESIGIETLPFEDCLCQMLDMIKPQRRDAITLGDLKRCKMTHVFFDTFFNLEKYLDHEQRDPFATQRDEYTSDWDRFAAHEYELLISEENE